MRYHILPIDRIVYLYTIEGVSENALAKCYGVDRGIIRRRLIKAGIKPRGRSEAERLKWSKMTPQQRKHQVQAAHDTVRGKVKSREYLLKRARGRQANPRMSSLEKLFFEAFKKAGIEVIPQYAIDIFNIDFAIPTVKFAIEIDGGHWHTTEHHQRLDKRKEQFLSKQGWSLIRFRVWRVKIEDAITNAIQTIRSHPAFKC